MDTGPRGAGRAEEEAVAGDERRPAVAGKWMGTWERGGKWEGQGVREVELTFKMQN